MHRFDEMTHSRPLSSQGSSGNFKLRCLSCQHERIGEAKCPRCGGTGSEKVEETFKTMAGDPPDLLK